MSRTCIRRCRETDRYHAHQTSLSRSDRANLVSAELRKEQLHWACELISFDRQTEFSLWSEMEVICQRWIYLRRHREKGKKIEQNSFPFDQAKTKQSTEINHCSLRIEYPLSHPSAHRWMFLRGCSERWYRHHPEESGPNNWWNQRFALNAVGESARDPFDEFPSYNEVLDQWPFSSKEKISSYPSA